jgi:hypothetical protein
MAGRSGMTGDCHVAFCEGLGVRFPRATRLTIFQFYRYQSYITGIFEFQKCGLVGEYQTKVKLFFHPFLDNTPPVPVQAGFDKLLMNHSQPS